MMWFALAVGIVASLVSLVYFVILLIGAFRQSALWGLAVLFLPFALVVYAIKFWSEAKKPFLISVGASVLSSVMLFVGFGAAVAQSVSAAQAQMEAEMLVAEKQAGAQVAQAEREGRTPVVNGAPVAPSTNEGIDRVIEAVRVQSEAARAVPANLYPDEGPIDFGSARRYVGERLRVVGTNGSELSARLVDADSRRLRFERSIGNGTVTFEFARNEVARLERLQH